MKRLELRLAELEDQLEPGVELDEGRSQLTQLSSSYDRYLEELGVLDESTPERKRLLLRMARLFGECEAAMPPSMVAEVDRYIAAWQRGTRLADALERAAEGGYAVRIAEAFDRQHLPPQYFFVALQESDFRLDACGPDTRFGVAKGPWQFIPGTASAYGLKLGPLYLQRRPDPQDERHDLDLASEAAARYIRDLYLREAGGSGLLVLAMYNYGGRNVRRLIRSLPEGPSERNFWRLLIDHRQEFPRETYDYVMRIFSAAVICEKPSLFGFGFAPPLDGLES
jgi:soluble lytic murein transglycosylase-like protein